MSVLALHAFDMLIPSSFPVVHCVPVDHIDVGSSSQVDLLRPLLQQHPFILIIDATKPCEGQAYPKTIAQV